MGAVYLFLYTLNLKTTLHTMDVIFASTKKDQNRIGPILIEGKEIVLNKGFYKTTDKEEIKGLLEHTFYQRGRYEMVSDPELVGAYLENNDEPDYISEEYLEEVSKEAIMEIGKAVGTRNQVPTLIKAELRNQPVTSAIANIVKADMEEKESSSSKSKSKKKKTATKKKSS